MVSRLIPRPLYGRDRTRLNFITVFKFDRLWFAWYSLSRLNLRSSFMIEYPVGSQSVHLAFATLPRPGNGLLAIRSLHAVLRGIPGSFLNGCSGTMKTFHVVVPAKGNLDNLLLRGTFVLEDDPNVVKPYRPRSRTIPKSGGLPRSTRVPPS